MAHEELMVESNFILCPALDSGKMLALLCFTQIALYLEWGAAGLFVLDNF